MAFCMISDNGAKLPSAIMKEMLELRNQYPRLKECMRERKTGILDQKPFKRERDWVMVYNYSEVVNCKFSRL